MRKEISFLIVTAIIALGIVLIYYWGGQPTGFAVIDQYKDETNCTDAGYTWENITTEEGCDIFSYGVGFINSTGYTLTGEEGATNFTVTGAWNITNESFPVAIPEQEYIVDSETWIVTNLTATEYSYVNFTYTYDNQTCGSVTGGQCVGPDEEPAVTVSISEPSEGYESSEDIPLTFTTTGNNISCSYEITSDNGTFMKEGTLSGCANTTFDLPDYDGDENYIAIVYVTGPAGNASATSEEFWISSPSDEDGETTEEEEVVEEEVPVIVQTPSITQISITALGGQDIIQGHSNALALSVQNTGTNPVSACSLTGDDSGWITITGGAQNIAVGASASFGFSINIPEETTVGAYTLGLSVTCAETSASSSVAVNVIQKKIDFNITDVRRTRENRVSVDYIITELAGEDQDLEIYFSIKDASGVEVGNASQNRSIDANDTDDFRTNVQINATLLPVNETTGESIETDLTLSASFNSQVYSSSVREPIVLGAPIVGAAIFEGIGAGEIAIVVIVIGVLVVILFVVKKIRSSGKTLKTLFQRKKGN